MKSISRKDARELSNSGEVEIGFGSGGVEGFSSLETRERLEGIDSLLNGDSFVVEGDPLVSIPEDTGIETFVSIRINVDAVTVSGRSTRTLL